MEGFILIKKLFIEETDHILSQFFRYFFVGGLAFAVDFGTLTALTFFPFFSHYDILAATISFVLGLTVNYLLSVRWVFKRRNVENKTLEFLVFAGIGVIGLGLNALFIWGFTDHVFVWMFPALGKQPRILLSKLVSTALVYLWNFFARKLTLFK